MNKLFFVFLLIAKLSAADDYDYLIDKIEHIEKDLNILQKQFYKGTKPKQEYKSESISINYETRIADLEERIRILIGNIEELEHLLNVSEQNNKRLAEDIEFRFNEIDNKIKNLNTIDAKKDIKDKDIDIDKQEIKEEKQNNILGTIKSTDLEKQKPEIKEKNNHQEEFDRAFALIKLSKLEDSEIAFNSLIAKKPGENLEARSLYWIGEINIAKSNYEKAAINFLQSYKRYPKHSKAPESLIKLVVSLGKLKKKKEACSIIAKIRKEFPNINNNMKIKIEEESKKLSCD